MPTIPPCLLDDLREALENHFTREPVHPDVVDFRITEEDDGLAWTTDGALLAYETRTEPAEDFAEGVGTELDAITDFRRPRFGDTLRIRLQPR